MTIICVLAPSDALFRSKGAGDKDTIIVTEDIANSVMQAAADHLPSSPVSRQSRNLHRPGQIPDVKWTPTTLRRQFSWQLSLCYLPSSPISFSPNGSLGGFPLTEASSHLLPNTEAMKRLRLILTTIIILEKFHDCQETAATAKDTFNI